MVPVPRELRWSILVFLGVDLLGMLLLAAIAIAPGGCRRRSSRRSFTGSAGSSGGCSACSTP